MESMAKHAGTKVIFVDKSASEELSKEDVMQALEAKEFNAEDGSKGKKSD